MPHAVAGFVAGAAQLIISGLTAVGFSYGTAVAILDVGIKIAGIALLGKAAESLVPDLPDVATSARSQQIIVRGTLEHQRIIYGEMLVGGTLVYVNAAGTHNQALYHVVAVAGHEIEDITDMWLNDIEIPEAAIDWAPGNGSVDSGDYRGNFSAQETVYFTKHLGGSQSADPELVSAFTEWTNSHGGNGIAYFTSRFDFFEGNEQVWSGGAPNLIRALVKGKKVYNPRSDSSQSFGTGPHRVDSAPTWEYSNNPALCWADYLIDSDLGMGLDPSKIDYGYVASAAEYCDGVVYTPVGTSKRYTCNGVLFTGDTHEQNLNKILSSFNGSQSRFNGKWHVRPFAYNTPTLELNEDYLAGDLEIQMGPDEDDRFNTVRGTYIDPTRRWQAQEAPVIQSSEYLDRDNGKVRYRDVQFPMTTDNYMAQRLMYGILETGNFEDRVIFPANFKALNVEVGGTVSLTIDRMNWDQKLFRVTNAALQDMQGIKLMLRSEESGAYTDVGTAEYQVYTNGDYTTASPGVPAPNSFDSFLEDDRIRLTWSNPPARLFEYIDIYRSTVNSFDNAELIASTFRNGYSDNPQMNIYHYYYLQARNYAGEVSTYVGPQQGVVVRDSMLWLSDNQFELTKPNFNDTTHWYVNSAGTPFLTDVSTNNDGVNTVTHGSISVQSLGVGLGGTKNLRFTFHAPSEWAVGANRAIAMNNRRTVPAIPSSMECHVRCRYRVNTWSNVNSFRIAVNVLGMQNINEESPFTSQLGGKSIFPTGVTGWQVFSDTIPMSAHVNTYTFFHANIQFIPYAGTPVGTMTLEIDIDNFIYMWKEP